MKTSDKLKKYPKKYWLIPLVLFIVPLSVEWLFRDISYQYSITAIKDLQEWMNNNGISRALIPKTYDALSFTNINMFYMICCVLVYNFLDVYKSFILILSIFFSNFLSSFLCFIYHCPRPYMVYHGISPYFRLTDWGYPSTQIVTMIAFFCTFYKVIFKSKLIKKKLALKIVIGIFFGLINIFYIFLHFAGGLITLEQIGLSIFIGLVVYFTMFSIFEAKVNNAKQFYTIVHFRFIYYLCINAVMVAFLVIFHFFIVDQETSDYYISHIDQQKKEMEKTPGFLSVETIEFFKLSEANFCNVLCFLLTIFVIIGLKLELYLSYGKNFELWKKSNFENRDGHTGVNYSIYSDHQYIKGTQWNHTGGCATTMRFFVLIILSAIGYLPSIIIHFSYKVSDPNDNTQKGLRYAFFIAFPFFYVSFGMFFLFKWVCRKIGLTNKG